MSVSAKSKTFEFWSISLWEAIIVFIILFLIPMFYTSELQKFWGLVIRICLPMLVLCTFGYVKLRSRKLIIEVNNKNQREFIYTRNNKQLLTEFEKVKIFYLKKYWVNFALEYDALGRRTAKINLSSKRIKRFLWDGNVPLHEWEYDLSERPNLSRDKDNLLVYDKEEPVTDNLITWVFDENSFVPAAKLVGDKSYSILTDHLGTPYEAYDENGEKVWARELDLYGNAIAGDSSFIPFLYQGQYYDEEIGLAYNRFRYYSPESGTYISQDPIGLAGNNPNFYGYTFDCNTEVDVLGLNILDDILANPASVWGKSAKELEDEINKIEGINASTSKTTRGSKKADKVSINGKSQISQIQVHPGGGRHTEGPYYKISTSSKGTIKVIDPTDYKYQGDNCLFYDYNGNRGHFIENGIDEKGKTTYIWQELEHNH